MNLPFTHFRQNLSSNLVFSLWCFAERRIQVFDSARCTCFTITVFLIELVKLSFDLWCCTCFTRRFRHFTNHIIDLWRSSWYGCRNFSPSLLQKLSVMYCGTHCVKPGSSDSYNQLFQCTWVFFLLPHAVANYRQPMSLFLQLAFKSPDRAESKSNVMF